MKTALYESLIESIIHKGYGIADGFIEERLMEGLLTIADRKYQKGTFHQAGIGKGEDFTKDQSIRSDYILWIQPDTGFMEEQAFLAAIADFVAYMNRTCFTAINNYEFHYATYPVGSFYGRHLDQFKNDDSRKFSIICYLNPNWSPSYGGELVIYTEGGMEKILPIACRMVCFESARLEHEVLMATKPRKSITGWLRSEQGAPI